MITIIKTKEGYISFLNEEEKKKRTIVSNNICLKERERSGLFFYFQ
jgi:hypothetical protein